MSFLSEFREALTVLELYNKTQWLSAEHDMIYSDVSAEMLPEDSVHGGRLIELGWHVDSDLELWVRGV